MRFKGLISVGGIVAFVLIVSVSLVGAQTIQTLCTFAGTNGATPSAAMTLGSDGNFYGTTSGGGSSKGISLQVGTTFRVANNGTLNMLVSFNTTNGAYPTGSLVLAPDGNLYGTTQRGGGLLYGGGGYGTVFRVTTNGSLSTLVSFNNANGSSPIGLTLGTDGNFYGTTGGSLGGKMFMVTTNGTMTTLISFNPSINIPAALTLGNDGNFYGVTYSGNNGSYGTVFMVTTNGILTTLFAFSYISGQYPNGENPDAALTLGPDGNFYGTTYSGGTNNGSYGTVFRVTTNGVLTTLVSFNNSNGAHPHTALTLGPDGNFYGTTSGTIFVMTPYGLLIKLLASSANSLTLGPDGNLYGTTTSGGILGYGTIFRLLLPPVVTVQPQNAVNNADTKAVFTIGVASPLPLSFQWQRNGTNLIDGGNIVGSTSNTLTITSVSSNDAAIYAVTVTNSTGSVTSSNVTLTVNYPPLAMQALQTMTFFNNANGNNPFGTLTLGPDGSFYGTTLYGGSSGYGTVFNMTTNGTLSTLVSFNYANGEWPTGLTLGNDGSFYGTTYGGGSTGYGTVFRVTTNGTLTTLVTFNNSNGANPKAGLTLGPDGSLYGTTAVGGNTNLNSGSGVGTVFKVTTNGDLTTLVVFNNSNGAIPIAVTLGLDGNFYGTTFSSGNNYNGTIFKMTPDGILTTLGYFSGSGSQIPLTLGPDGNFYGMNSSDGTRGEGTVFRMTTNGLLTTLISFNYFNGAYPNAALTLGTDGNIYGTTEAGGNNHAGTVFMVTTNGTLATLVSFNSTNGGGPETALLLGPDGNFYGTTSGGGITNSTYPYGMGTVFHLQLPPVIIIQPQSQTNIAGATVTFNIGATSLHPMSFQWQRNGTNLNDGGNISGAATNALTISNVSDADLANYTVVMTNAYGNVTSSNATLTVLYPPVITAQPLGQRIVLGNGVAFNVAVSGTAPFNYQWRFNAGNLLNATNVLYALPAVGTNHTGNYSVVVTNFAGSVTSSNALLVVLVPPLLALQLWAGYPLLNLNGMLSNNFTVQYSPDLTGTNWITLQTFSNLLTSPYLFLDPAGSGQPARFYRVWMQ